MYTTIKNLTMKTNVDNADTCILTTLTIISFLIITMFMCSLDALGNQIIPMIFTNP